eukprot:TRINITY_DN74441_c0_g1_i1.p1 TRINITY_DN74441_c0_g1~~TRINITY_DN74441_c0_g1_i1.p1  ORF type:complete len:231 (+),score=45.25 TRINITY_DN74441_c0_g1_i1:84-776(+)
MLAAPGERHGRGGAGVGGAGVHLASRPVPGLVLALQSDGDLDKLLNEIQGRWVIVEFVAGWSAACTAMRQPFEDLAQQNLEAVFLHVDVDVLCSDAGRYGATRVPMYSFFWNGTKEAAFAGASERKLREMLRNCVELGPCPVEVTYQERVANRLARQDAERKSAAKHKTTTTESKTRVPRSRPDTSAGKAMTSSPSSSPTPSRKAEGKPPRDPSSAVTSPKSPNTPRAKK